MASCVALKAEYDQCFLEWFQKDFVWRKSGEDDSSAATGADPCANLFSRYRKCLQSELKEKGLDGAQDAAKWRAEQSGNKVTCERKRDAPDALDAPDAPDARDA